VHRPAGPVTRSPVLPPRGRSATTSPPDRSARTCNWGTSGGSWASSGMTWGTRAYLLISRCGGRGSAAVKATSPPWAKAARPGTE